MREIKFRAWDKRRNWMLYDGDSCGYVEQEKHEIDVVNLILSEGYLEDLTFLQFTGLADKEGYEIYEGDILFHPLQGARQVIYPFAENVAAFGLKSSNGMINTLQDADKLYEIIGNVFENPELLEETK